MKTIKQIVFFSIIIISLFINKAIFAQPNVISVSGSINHGNTIVMSGSDFGTKSPAAPLLWDNCESRTVDNDEAVENGGQIRGGKNFQFVAPNNYNWTGDKAHWHMRYRSFPFTPTETIGAISAPHSNSTKCLAGGHRETRALEGTNEGRNVFVQIDSEVTEGNTRWFVMFYHRTTMPESGSRSHKFVRWNSGAGYSQGDTSYIQWTGYNSGSYHGCIPDHNCPYCNLKIGDEWCNARTHTLMWDMPNPNLDWVHAELRLLNESGDGSFLMVGEHGNWAIKHKDCTDVWNWNQRSFTLGDFYAHHSDPQDYYHDDAWRLYDDIYIDNSLSRVIMTDNENYDSSTICEPQIPSAWSDNSITITVNRGALAPCEKHYLFVFDADNNHNAVGYPVSVCTSAGEPPCPPKGLKIVQ